MRRRVSLLEWVWKTVQHGERRLIRIMVLASVILVVMQLSAIRDPVQFYIAMAEKVEAPPLDLPVLAASAPTSSTAESINLWNITLKATPAAPVRVLQNGKVIAVLAKGEQALRVSAGEIQLDAMGIAQKVQVQVLKKDSRLAKPQQGQIFTVQGTIQNVSIRPQ